MYSKEFLGKNIRQLQTAALPRCCVQVVEERVRAHALGEFLKKEWAGYGKKRGCDWITDRFRRTELWRKTYNPEHQALHRVLCTEPSGQYSIQLGQGVAPGVAPLL